MGAKGLAACVLLLLECWIFLAVPRVNGIKIAAYNVRIFGQRKLQNNVAMNMISRIVREYDIILIQEVRGIHADVPGELLNRVNQLGNANDYQICNTVRTFKPAGSTHRELYLYLYRPATVTCGGTEEAEAVNANYNQAFRRPPTVATFNTVNGNVPFFIVGIHTQPQRAVTEINSLVAVYNTFKNRYMIDSGFIMGDYNYGGTYVPKNMLDMLDIDMDPPFLRLISKDQGTTVKPFGPVGKKPYDRIYIAPSQTYTQIITSVGVDTFTDMLTEEKYYKTVSDHYPVYFDVNIGGGSAGQTPTDFAVTIDGLNAALIEECGAVIVDYNATIDDDLEEDFFNFCKNCKPNDERKELSDECLFTELEDGDENGDVASVASSILLTLLAIFIGCSII